MKTTRTASGRRRGARLAAAYAASVLALAAVTGLLRQARAAPHADPAVAPDVVFNTRQEGITESQRIQIRGGTDCSPRPLAYEAVYF